MTIEKHSLPSTSSAIYAQTENINYFLKTPLSPDSSTGVVNNTSEVKSHARRRFPGDTSPISVPKTTRVTMYDPGRRNGSATPGKQMLLDDGIEKRAFTYTGPWTDVHAFLVSNAKMDLSAYSASARYVISAAGETALANKSR